MQIVKPKIYVEDVDGIKIMKNIERACRTCYKSENLIKEDSYKGLITGCIGRGHESILEHEKVSVRMICDIGVYKDLTRHRIASFSIESTRYCNYGKDKFNKEIKFIEPIFYKEEADFNYSDIESRKSYLWESCMKDIEDKYLQMVELGCKPDELRMLLPHSTAAEVNMTANIREWRHILKLRCSAHTHPAIRQLLIPLLLHFKTIMPELFADIEYDTQFPVNKEAELIVGLDEEVN